ncbi:MAG: MalY/PatB family protein [Lachnospiraceae bacterium]
MSCFEKGITRRGTNCVKWDVPFITEDTIPMWVADMDFEIAPAITKRLQEIAIQGAFGYQFLSDQYYQSVISWMKRRHQYTLIKEEICYIPNVVMGLSLAVQTVSDKGDEIIIQTPVYGLFFSVVKDNERILVESKLKCENGYYIMDLEDFERKITPKTKAVMICNPHNPSGRVWSREELEALVAICVKHELYIISDDIHCELIAPGQTHTFISMLSEDIKNRCIVCTSPSKAFNLAGIHVANALIANQELRERYIQFAEKAYAAENNAFAEAALIGAYEESEAWLEELNAYLAHNINYFVDYIHQHIPKLGICKPEGTYLVWVDCRNLNIEDEKIKEFLFEQCHIVVNEGEFFGKDGRGYVRFNLACPRAQVIEALKRLEAGINKL